jgi:hypothetical protein
MGSISKKLHRKLASNSKNLPTKAPQRRPGEPLPGGVQDMQTLINEGFDPIHAAYVFIQQISSHFAEGVSQMAEMKAYYKAAAAAEDTYMPAGPPISPLTASFFTTWAFYDLRIGNSGDTIGDCQIELNDLIWLNADQLDALKKLNNSRMGIYEQVGFDGPRVHLRELITEEEFVCHNTSGYRGASGELWYVRLLPPLLPELANYHIAFTTPYILIESTKNDWTQFLKRSMLRIKADDERATLRQLLKYGFDRNYWNEFVFRAYHHHNAEAIFLAGIPDLKSTLPHA